MLSQKGRTPWDIVFGHHSHIPQHIELVGKSSNPNIRKKKFSILRKILHLKIKNPDSKQENFSTNPDRIIVYSGGNFTSGENRKKHRNGLIAKFYIKPFKNKLVISKVKWSFTLTKKVFRTVGLNSPKNLKGRMDLKDVLA